MEVEPWLKFLGAIHKAKVDLKCVSSGAWFRGVTKSKYRLYPSLLRPHQHAASTREQEIFDNAEDIQPGMSSWERLVALQHAGIPTRLLDWTEVFGVAVFFALGGLKGETPLSPSIWVINPFRLAQRARKNNDDKRIGTFHHDSATDYYKHFIAGAQLTWPFEAPMPYRPPRIDPRIRAQRGFFTVHGTDVRPLDAIFPDCIRQVRVPQKAIPFASEFLELAGIDALSLFPDYSGLTKLLGDKAKKTPDRYILRMQERYE